MKLKNFYYYTTVLLLFFIIVINLVIITKRPVKAIVPPAGGRVILASQCAGPLPIPPNPICMGCAPLPSNMIVQLMPFGVSAVTFCPLMGAPTLKYPATPAIVGMQALGNLTAIAPVTVLVNFAFSE